MPDRNDGNTKWWTVKDRGLRRQDPPVAAFHNSSPYFPSDSVRMSSSVLLLSSKSQLSSRFPSRSKLLKLYQECHSRYLAEGLWQHYQSLLNRIARLPEVTAVLGEGAFTAVFKLARELMMNDLEIVGWSIYILRLGRVANSGQFASVLTYTGVAAKHYFDDDIDMLQAHLEKTLPSFTKSYNDWFKRHSYSLRISPKELNEQFRAMTDWCQGAQKPLLNYNALVDEILESAQPLHPPEEDQTFPLVPVPVKVVAARQLDDPELPEFTLQWSINMSLEKLGSLTELWPDKPLVVKAESPNPTNEVRLA